VFFSYPKTKSRRKKPIPQYAIMRFSKQKGGAGGLEAHHERAKEKYASNPDIDTNRSKDNFHIIKPTKSYLREINSRIEAAKCRTRKDSVRFIDTLITASPEFFTDKTKAEASNFFNEAVEFLSQRIGRHNIFSAVVHMDEKTPHLHLCFTPITADNRLSAKEIIGNRVSLSKWQDDFFTHMVRHYENIERGESASETGRRHIPMRLFKEAVRLNKQANRIKATLGDMRLSNVKEKRDEAIALFQKFFPRMENFETQMRKYKREIDRLLLENADLTKQVEDGRPRMAERMELFKLRDEIGELRQFCDSIPDDIKQQYKPQTKQHITKKQR